MATDKQRQTARENMRRTATKHGLCRGDTLSTYRACEGVLRNPLTLVAPCWTDTAEFTRGVMDEIGLRPEPDEIGRWRLVALPDLHYLLDLDGTPDPLIVPPAEAFEENPWLPHGDEFKPGYVQWSWYPKRRVPYADPRIGIIAMDWSALRRVQGLLP